MEESEIALLKKVGELTLGVGLAQRRGLSKTEAGAGRP